VLLGAGVVRAPQFTPVSARLTQSFHSRADGVVRSPGARAAQRRQQRDRRRRLRAAGRSASPAGRQPARYDPARRSALPPATGQTCSLISRFRSHQIHLTVLKVTKVNHVPQKVKKTYIRRVWHMHVPFSR